MFNFAPLIVAAVYYIFNHYYNTNIVITLRYSYVHIPGKHVATLYFIIFCNVVTTKLHKQLYNYIANTIY